jgi:acylphosphatase
MRISDDQVDSDLRRGHFFVSGIVQGVCFRMYTREKARELNLTGWVRNVSDGRVEIVAEGSLCGLGQLALWCADGPPMSEVSAVTEDYTEASGEFSAFSIAF